MKKRYLNIIIALFCLWTYSAYSQINCITDPPSPPVLSSVSVQPQTGNTEIKWKLSASPDIAAYVLYYYSNGDGMAFDTIWDPAATSYTLSSTVTKYKSESYVVAAMRLPRCTSILSNALNTIFTETTIDTCNNRVLVLWNSYTSIPEKKVIDYSILVSVNGSAFIETAKASSGETRYTLENFSTDAEYCFIVRANLEGATFSTSNKSCLSTRMQRPPQWIKLQ
jgi:hypothetical protein